MARPVDAVMAQVREFLGERMSTNPALLEQHSHGEDSYPRSMPDGVAFIETAEEASRVLALCNQHGTPVVPFGAGTSLEGHVTPVRGGISLDLARMTRVIEVNQPDMDCRIEPGVTRQALNEHLRDQGLFFPVDPGSHCTIGGMCATRASGTAAVLYGTIRENVLGLQVALPDGRLIRTGGRVRKSSTGYDLTRLFIGSEGTLGVITEITLRLHGIPEATSAAVCQFTTLADAVEAVQAVLAAGIPVARIELLDEAQMQACIAYSKLDMVPAPTLFFEFHGTPAGVEEQARQAEELATGFGAKGFQWAVTAEDRNRLWRARHDAYWASMALRPGWQGLVTDAIVPVSRLAEAVVGTQADIRDSGLLAPIAGHVGDGNFHTIILVPPGDAAAMERAMALDRRIVDRALSLGGSCSGEHGVGTGKREFLEREHGVEALAVMRQIKVALDPRGIMNPGKMFLNA